MIKSVKLKDIEASYKKDAQAGAMAMSIENTKYLKEGIIAENVDVLALENVKFLNEPQNKFKLVNVKEIKND